ncbi:MAG: MmgE/PrpD family protein [Acidobacteriaceae bacterium]|nr:MmgE/PrpD family protein [Acidobacteriaceae bacterium]
MNTCERIAAYTGRASWDAVSPEARGKLKQHVLDTIGCALGAISGEPIEAIRREETEVGATGPCSLIGGGSTTPERAAFHNGALVRYLDFMDTFLAPGEACHPSDNFAALLAAAELSGASGRDFLAALAVAYHIQCRLTASGVPIMRKGFDHTIQLSISLAAGIAKLLQLDEQQTANAIAICAVSGLGLAASRSGEHVPQWKGLASAATAFNCMHNVRLAKQGITGPLHVLQGPMGLEEVLGKPFAIDWDTEDYDGILACSIKNYNAEFHAQSLIDAILHLRQENGIIGEEVARVQVDIFKAGYDMIGGGKYLNPKTVSTKEDADHSLHYLVAVALLDGEVWPEQFSAERIAREDVQNLLQKVVSWLNLGYTREYPNSLKCSVRIEMTDGRIFHREQETFPGFFRQPLSLQALVAKFNRLANSAVSTASVQRIIESVARIEERPLSELIASLRELERKPAAQQAQHA